MLTFSAPLWLLALSALPLVWWLHRFHELDRAHPVAALFLWPARDAPGSRLRRSQRTEPIWLLRALTTGLLVLALCGPRWSSQGAGNLHLWIDDSPSMFVLEQGATRMAQALLALQRPLAESHFSSITMHSLGAPGESQALDPLAAVSPTGQMRAWTDRPRGEPELPAAALLGSGDTHWLLSDGASPGLAEWVRHAPISRIFTAGSSSENVGITGLALRRSGDTGGSARLLVTVENGGRETARRELEIVTGGERLGSATLHIAPGTQAQQVIEIPRAAGTDLRARISPTDALPLDDTLALSTAALAPVRTAVSNDCGSHLRAALAANPALAIGGDAGSAAGLNVYCGGDYTGQPGPALRSGGQGGNSPLQGPLLWLPAAGPLRDLLLDPAWLSASPGNTPAPGALVLLRSADRPLILFDVMRGIIDIRLDLAAPPLVYRPEYPLLLSGLVDLLLEETAGSGTLVSAARPGPVSIAPHSLALGTGRPGVRTDPAARDLAGALILAAILTLLLDLVLQHRRLPQRPRNPAVRTGSA